MFYIPYGPFDLGDFLDSEDHFRADTFWKKVEKDEPGLSKANGVYIFSIKFGSRYRPWYVGKTCSEKGFRGEVFQSHKLRHYFEASDGRRGGRHLHLIARVEENRGNFCRYSERSDEQIDRLETYLIGMSLAANADLRNNSKTRFHKMLNIEGVIGERYDGRPREAARALKNVLGIAKA